MKQFASLYRIVDGHIGNYDGDPFRDALTASGKILYKYPTVPR